MDAKQILLLWSVYTITCTSAQRVQIYPSPRAECILGGTLRLTCSNNGTGSASISYWNLNSDLGGTVRSRENSCTANGQIANETLYAVECTGNEAVHLIIKNMQLQQHGDVLSCSQAINGHRYVSSNTTVFVKVRVSTVMLNSPSSSTVTVAENSSVEFRCTTSLSRPAPSVSWYMDGNTTTTNDDVPILYNISQSPFAGSEGYVATNGSLTYKPSRTANGKHIFCESKDSTGETKLSNRKIRLNVTYKPESGPQIQGYTNNTAYSAIDGKQQTLKCVVTGGNPLPSLSWSCFTGNEQDLSSGQIVSKGWTWKTSSSGTCMCTSTQLGVSEVVLLNVTLLAPPTTPVFLLHSQTVQGTDTVKIIRDSSVSIICSATSSPSPDKYTWKYDGQSTALIQMASLYASQITADGRYWCEVGNTMTPSQGHVEVGNNSSYINIQRLYPPSVRPFNVEPVVEELTLSVECSTRPGNPAQTTYSWKRKLSSSSDNTWREIPDSSINGNLLLKTNIKRNDAGTYNCTASNVMRPTAEKQQNGFHSQSFILNVLYKTSISSFIEVNNPATQHVIVAENSTITLRCKVDSNPGSTISIWKDGEAKMSEENRKQMSYTYQNVTCNTAGLYSCVGYNEHNTEEKKPSKYLRLSVTCKPRLPSSGDFESNITSALNEEARLNITVVAYPVPEESQYMWSKRNGDIWEDLTSGDNLQINTSGLDSSLIILNVSVSDYQQYRVIVKNSYGQLQQEFFLNPYGKPNPPENVNVIDGSLEETSAKITWRPGFDGGPKQTFVVQYKKQGDSTWLEVTKEDEGTESMNVSLTGLAHGTSYVFRVYSKNIKGNSSFMDILSFQTLEKTETRSPAALIGGVTGGSLFFIIVLIGVAVLFVRRSSFKKGKSKASIEGNDRKPVYEEENDYGMQDNPMYVSAGPRQSTSKAEESSSGGAAVYSTVNKRTKAIDNDNEYAVVNKTNKAKAKQGKKEKEKSKQGFFKDKKGKKLVQEGDIYENAPSKDVKAVPAKDETIYENPESSLSTQKKNVNKDGLIYADLTFNDQPKGQKKLVIHGLDSMTEYVQVDFTKKADPLPDSDDENIPPKN